MRSDVAALYVDKLGPYPKLVEHWFDKERDARTYWGPLPVVAHPTCAPYSPKLGRLYQGNEHDCAERALEQVRRWGGILEHPANSKLWEPGGSQYMSRPGELPDAWGGYTIAVNQCDWGHPARKPTWLYMIRIPREAIVLPPPRKPTHWASGGRTPSSRRGSPVPPGIKVCSAQQRRRTPVAFAEWLLHLAALAAETRAA